MSKLALGLLSGAALGLLDGASAAFNPAAQSMLAAIIVAATVKGVLTGGAVGLAARRLEGVFPNMAAGCAIGAVLSLLAAIPAGSYLDIVLPGVLVGAGAGMIVAKWGRSTA